MNLNPYESSDHQDGSTTTVPPFVFGERQASGRPWTVVCLAIWHVVRGLLAAALIALLFAMNEAPPTHTLGLPLFVVGLWIAIGIGLWRGENWGWRGASFLNAIQVIQPLLELVTGQQPHALSIIEAIIGAIAFAVLFSDRVLEYFGMYGIQKLPTAGRIIGICCVLLAIITFSN